MTHKSKCKNWTMKPLEENIGDYTVTWWQFKVIRQNKKGMILKIGKSYFIATKDFCLSKDTIKKIYRQITDRTIFLMMDLFSDYIRHLYNSVIKPQKANFKSGILKTEVNRWCSLQKPRRSPLPPGSTLLLEHEDGIISALRFLMSFPWARLTECTSEGKG